MTALLTSIARLLVVLAGAVLGAVGATYAWDHWIPHPACAPGEGRYRFPNCLSVPPPLWLKTLMIGGGILLALGAYEMFNRWRSSHS